MTCLLQSFHGALSGIALHICISKLPLHFYFSTQITQDYVQKPSNLRRKGSKFHVYTLAREGTVSLGVFPHVNLIISSAVQGRLMLCQDTCTDPTGKSVLTPCKAVARAGSSERSSQDGRHSFPSLLCPPLYFTWNSQKRERNLAEGKTQTM